MNYVVLVVDDEPLLLELLCDMLADLDCEAICVDCPVKGLEKLETDKRIAMLITDIQMPIMSGFELAERAKKTRPEMPVVLMSGAVPSSTEMPVLAKPLSRQRLAEIVAPLNSA